MSTVKITAKRQATLPVEVCNDLGVQPGDSIKLTPVVIGDDKVWVMSPVIRQQVDWSWLGAAQVAADKDHDLKSIRSSIGKALGNKGL